MDDDGVIEQMSSAESEESSPNSGENQSSAERNRARIRCSSPRRSSSPMRRVQIGRTSSRRQNSLTMKGLSCYPARDKDVAETSNGDEPPSQNPANNVKRLAYLFESKQMNNQSDDVPKRLSLTNIAISANKSVLRRWSAGMEEPSSECQIEISPQGSETMISNDVDGAKSNPEVEVEVEKELLRMVDPMDTGTQRREKEVTENVDIIEPEHAATEKVESIGGSKGSLEWSRQKEVELNQMMMKMMENQPVKRNDHQNSNNKNLSSELRGGFYNQYKEKRDERLRGEIATKRAEKNAKFKATPQIFDERKAEMASANTGVIRRNVPLRKAQKSVKETSKSIATNKVSPKTPVLPPPNKSRQSTLSSQRSKTSPAKPTAVSSGGTTPTHRKPQPTPSIPRPNTKVQKSQPRQRNPKESQRVDGKSLKTVSERKQEKMKEGGRDAKTKVSVASEDSCGIISAKPSFYNKVTKKNSVVPLESKSFLRKGSHIGSAVGPLVEKKKNSSILEDHSEKCTDANKSKENVVDAKAAIEVCEGNSGSPAELASLASSTKSCGEMDDSSKQAAEVVDYGSPKPLPKHEAEEELTISNSAWVEIEEDHAFPPPSISELLSPLNAMEIKLPNVYVRQSLSQMMQEDSSAIDNSEWGNAETPVSLVSAKDSPKGLKRLLKFGRKNKGHAYISGCSSPSFFSDGEENDQEPRNSTKRNNDNVRKKAAINTNNAGQHKSSYTAGEILSAKPNIRKLDAQSRCKLQKGHVPASVSSKKG